MTTNKKRTGASSHPEKARIGAIGENEVVSKLMQLGWDAFNANCSLKNYKSIDVVCLKPIDGQWKPDVAFVQVKTSVEHNITTGFTIGASLEREVLEQNVKGPYVFVYIDTSNSADWKFHYFILSRKQFIDLLYASNYWYFNDWYREKEISKKSPAGLKVEWLMGGGEDEDSKHKAFHNPLNGVSCEDCWENIWKD